MTFSSVTLLQEKTLNFALREKPLTRLNPYCKSQIYEEVLLINRDTTVYKESAMQISISAEDQRRGYVKDIGPISATDVWTIINWCNLNFLYKN